MQAKKAIIRLKKQYTAIRDNRIVVNLVVNHQFGTSLTHTVRDNKEVE